MKKYTFKPYNILFPKIFDEEKLRLLKNITGDCQLEHIGSTAIPNLGGKGIIDIMIGTPKDKMTNISNQLQKLGYIFKPNASTSNRLFLRTEYPEDFEKETAFHLHIVEFNGQEWKNALAFRNYLRTHPTDLKTYAQIKQKAAKNAKEDKDKYMSIKEKVIEEIIKKALKN